MHVIIFDLDYTLYNYSIFLRGAFSFAIEQLASEQKINEISVRNAFFLTEKNTALSDDRFLDKLLENSNLSKQYLPVLLNAYRAYLPTYLPLYHDSFSLLTNLKTNGYKLGLLTDGRTLMQQRKLAALGISHFFDAMVFSHDFKTEKPNPIVFEAICQSLDCSPSQCLMVGDNYEKDILGAINVGMNAVWFQNGPFAANNTKKPLANIQKIVSLLDLWSILNKNE